jgi:hypothetical protein
MLADDKQYERSKIRPSNVKIKLPVKCDGWLYWQVFEKGEYTSILQSKTHRKAVQSAKSTPGGELRDEPKYTKYVNNAPNLKY